MRSSSRTEIVEAALRVVDAEGDVDITYDSVARETGLSKAGLMYHFPTKEALMVAVMEHVVARWQDELCTTLGTPLEESTLADRVRAFVRFAGEGGVTQGEFVVFAEAVRRPALSAPWLTYLRTWFGFGFGDDTSTLPLLLVWLAANGMWIAEATGILTVTDDQRRELLAMLDRLAEGGHS
jgi:AcrR family transcriptional regulator